MRQTINVYKFVKTEWLLLNKKLIFDILFKKDTNTGKLVINSTSGFIKYSDTSVIFNANRPSNLIAEASKVVSHLSKFIKDTNIKLSEAAKNLLFQNPDGEKLKTSPFLFPERHMKLICCTPVWHFNNQWVDHWVAKYKIELSLGNEFKLYESKNTKVKALVLGAEIEFRVGKNGEIGGMDYRWKSITKTSQTSIDGHEINQDNIIGHGYDLIYLLDSEAYPQAVLAPYFFSLRGHNGFLRPASKYSFNIRLRVVNDDTNRKFIAAYVEGGSGSFEFEWAGWDHRSVLKKGLQRLVPEPTLEGKGGNTMVSMILLDRGMSNIFVKVKDLKTGVIRIKQDMFFHHHYETSISFIENVPSTPSLTS